MRNAALRTLALIGLAGFLLGACGGKAVGGGLSGSSGSGGSAASGGSAGSTSSSGGSADDGGRCVNVDLSSYDQSCNQASDCVYVQSGEVCSGQCGCGNAVINAAGEARYRQATASIDWAECMCLDQPTPQCVDHRCASGSSVEGSCVNVDLSTYDQTCTADTDCIGVTAGQICTGGCACGGSTINVNGEARYQAAVSSVQTLACPCAADGIPRCIQNRCTLSGGPGRPSGFGDGG
jgi:hypothetical protein